MARTGQAPSVSTLRPPAAAWTSGCPLASRCGPRSRGGDRSLCWQWADLRSGPPGTEQVLGSGAGRRDALAGNSWRSRCAGSRAATP